MSKQKSDKPRLFIEGMTVEYIKNKPMQFWHINLMLKYIN